MKKVCLYALLTALSVYTHADELSPDQWQSILAAGGHYAAADGSERMQVRQHEGRELLSLAREVTNQELPADAETISTEQRGTGPALMLLTAYRQGGRNWVLAVSMAIRSGGGALSLAHVMDPNLPGATEHLAKAGSTLLMSAMQGESVGTQVATARKETSSPRPAHNDGGTGPKVERVLFDLDYSYGVGGAAYPDYAPVVLFADGTACKCLEAAIEDIDLGRVKRASPKNVGEWSRQGANFKVRWTGVNKPEVLKPSIGPPTALPGPNALRGRYQSIGGGGNTALGGTVTVASVEDLTFFGDGSFSQSNTNFSLSGAATASSKRGKAGSWSLAGSTLTLAYLDGQTIRTSVFYSAKRKPSANFGRFGVIWIGGDDFKRVE